MYHTTPIQTLRSLFHYRPTELTCVAGKPGTGKTLALILDAIDIASDGGTCLFVTTETPEWHLTRYIKAIAYRYGYDFYKLQNNITIVDGESVLRGSLIFGETFPFELFGLHGAVIIDCLSIAAHIETPIADNNFGMESFTRAHALREFTFNFRHFLHRYKKIGVVSEQVRRSFTSRIEDFDDYSIDVGLTSIMDTLVVMDTTEVFTVKKHRYSDYVGRPKRIQLPFKTIIDDIKPLMNGNWDYPSPPIPDNFRMVPREIW